VHVTITPPPRRPPPCSSCWIISARMPRSSRGGNDGVLAPFGSPYVGVNVGNDGFLGPFEVKTLTLEFLDPSGAPSPTTRECCPSRRRLGRTLTKLLDFFTGAVPLPAPFFPPDRVKSEIENGSRNYDALLRSFHLIPDRRSFRSGIAAPCPDTRRQYSQFPDTCPAPAGRLRPSPSLHALGDSTPKALQ